MLGMSEIGSEGAWKVRYWTAIRDFAETRIKELRTGKFQLADKIGHDLIPDQIAQWEGDLAEANQRLNDLLGP
jgi:hypothetical protein